MKTAAELTAYYQKKNYLTGLTTEKALIAFERFFDYLASTDSLLLAFAGFSKKGSPVINEGLFLCIVTSQTLFLLATTEKQQDIVISLASISHCTIQYGLYYSHLVIESGMQKQIIDSATAEECFHLLNQLLPANCITAMYEPPNQLTQQIEFSFYGSEPITENTVSWYVTVRFGKSSSQKFQQALAFAKKTASFKETQPTNQNSLFEATYTKESYLDFIRLYELVGKWKSTSIVMNGELMPQKIIGGLNYCYGDNLKSQKSDFCFGASHYTSNPFGCHRLKISSGNHPWWSFGAYSQQKQWVINKKQIEARIIRLSQPYLQCPAFNLDFALAILEALPDSLSYENDSENWIFYNDSVVPKLETQRNINWYNINIKRDY